MLKVLKVARTWQNEPILFNSTPKTSYDAKAKMTAGSPDFLPCLSKKNWASDDEHEGENISSTELYFKRIKMKKQTMQVACKHNFVFGLFFGFFSVYQHLLGELEPVTNIYKTPQTSAGLDAFKGCMEAVARTLTLAHICRPEAVFPLFLNHSTCGLISRFFLAVPQDTRYSRWFAIFWKPSPLLV